MCYLLHIVLIYTNASFNVQQVQQGLLRVWHQHQKTFCNKCAAWCTITASVKPENDELMLRSICKTSEENPSHKLSFTQLTRVEMLSLSQDNPEKFPQAFLICLLPSMIIFILQRNVRRNYCSLCNNNGCVVCKYNTVQWWYNYLAPDGYHGI